MALTTVNPAPGLAQLLAQGLGEGLDINLKERLRKRQAQEEFGQKQQLFQEAAQQKQQLAEQEQARKQQRAQLFSQLLSGGSTESALGSQPGGQIGAQPSRDQILQFAAQSGYSPQELSQLEGIYAKREKEKSQQEQFEKKYQSQKEQFEKKQQLQRESFRIKEEAPERKIVTEEAKRFRDRAQTAEQKINDYKSLKTLASSGQLRSGKQRQLLDRLGLGTFWQQPASDVAEKLLGDINIASLSDVTTPGKATSSMLQQIAKTNPSLMMTDEGIKYTSDIRILGEKIQQQMNAELNKIRSASKGRPLPIDAIDRALKNSEPKIKALHKKQQELVTKIAQQGGQSFDDLPDPSQYVGKKVINPDTGETLISDGRSWKKSNQ